MRQAYHIMDRGAGRDAELSGYDGQLQWEGPDPAWPDGRTKRWFYIGRPRNFT